MKFLLDNNLSYKIAAKLNLDFEIKHVSEFGLVKSSDRAVWDFAKKNSFIIVTKDDDFVTMSYIKGFPPHIVWVKIGNCTTSDVVKLLSNNIESIISIIKTGNVGIIEVILDE